MTEAGKSVGLPQKQACWVESTCSGGTTAGGVKITVSLRTLHLTSMASRSAQEASDFVIGYAYIAMEQVGHMRTYTYIKC